MNCLVVVAMLAVGASAAPAHHLAAGYAAGYAAAPAVAHVATRVHQAPATAHVAETYHAGPAVAHTRVEHGVVGHQTVQVGTKPVQVGVEHYIAGQSVHQPQPYSYVAEPAKSYSNTVPLAEPALPVAAPVAPVIAPAPRNLGPAPADTVTHTKIAAPVRTHTIVTPKRTQIVPELQVNKVPYDAPYNVPVPVEREVVVTKHVDRPYTVEVPKAVPVAQPYKVHQVKEVVQTPVIRQHTTSYTHHAPAVAVGVAHQAYAAAPVAVAAHGVAAAAPVAAIH